VNEQLIDERSRRELREKFQRELQNEVGLSVFVGPENKEYCDFTVQLCEELSELDSRIAPTVYQDSDEKIVRLAITRTPTVLIGWDQGYKVKYTGAPAGQEAGGFIETISLVSRGESGLQGDSKAKLQNVDRDVSIQVYVTPTCPYCPRAVLLAHQIAIESKGRVESECVEASQNMNLARQFNVSSVPQQVINGDMGSVSIGVQPEAKFIDDVLRYGSSRYAEIMEAEEAKRALAERLVDEGYADYLSMSRPFIREPWLIARWQSGDLRKATCISCNGCLGAARSGQGIYCVQDRKAKEKLRS